jgi:quercetin 2,3-dioxygenase
MKTDMKTVLGIHSNPRQHWVGDGFPVRTLFSYQTHAKQLSPFLMLDYAGPAEFEPSPKHRGVGHHPHRGFETVTIVYEGEVAHRDSSGGGGIIGPGDVQWMTAGSGIIHDEFHSDTFTQHGGTLEMVQLWVNLPAKDKMTPPKYQAIKSQQIPVAALPNNGGQAHVIAGDFMGALGPANTFTPMQVCSLKLNAGAAVQLPVRDHWNTALIVLNGQIKIDQHHAHEGQLVVLSAKGEGVVVHVHEKSMVLLLSGEPIDEPVVGYGPFVMNTKNEIEEAINDFNLGRFGTIPQAT